MKNNIFVKGIETNNLKNIDVEIMKNAINLVLGPSGSGKSTLVYETIAKIGQHEYLSMFSDNLPEPLYKVRSFVNMLPTVPIMQSNKNNNLRSSIGTYFGLNKKISLLYSVLFEVEESFFTLNKKENVCENCHGLGIVRKLDVNKVVDYNIPIKKNPFRCWNKYKDFFEKILFDYCDDCGIDIEKKIKDLNKVEQQQLLYGISEKKYSVRYRRGGRYVNRTTKYYGVMSEHSMIIGYSLGKSFYSDLECDCCHGRKYNEKYQDYKIHGLSIGDFFTIEFDKLLLKIKKMISEILDIKLKSILTDIYKFVDKAVELKLGYLFLNRSIPTLSGGELQRLRLVQVLNTQLSNLLIILDEPLAELSINEKLIIKKNIVELSKNNTVIIVDHETTFLDVSQNVICLGEKGGNKGGYIIDSDKYLKKQIILSDYPIPQNGDFINIVIDSKVYQYTGVRINIALNRMNLITGDSGIGKSTLLREYFPQVFDKYIYISQKLLLGNKNSTVATVLNISTKIFSIYSTQFKTDKNFFSNLTGNKGCCKKCGGAGYIEYGNRDENLLQMECPECQGTGFSSELKKYKIEGKSIFEIWMMTIEEAVEYYRIVDKKIYEVLVEAKLVMLGYLKVGQLISTLSGGENIRLKILKLKHSSARVAGVDEPFKGLNNEEKNIMGVFLDELRKKGKTIIVVDHSEMIEHFFSNHIIIKKIDNKIVGQ